MMTECPTGVAVRASVEPRALAAYGGVVDHDDLRRRRGGWCPEWCWCEVVDDLRYDGQEVTLEAVNEAIDTIRSALAERATRSGHCPKWCACHAECSESQVLDPPTLLVALPPTVAGATTE